MSLPILFSPNANQRLIELREYVEKEFGIAAAESFLNKVENALNHMSNFPFGYPISETMDGLRKCLVQPYTLLFYMVGENAVEIVAVVDGRMDPTKSERTLHEDWEEY